jgi:hypothetical protein
MISSLITLFLVIKAPKYFGIVTYSNTRLIIQTLSRAWQVPCSRHVLGCVAFTAGASLCRHVFIRPLQASLNQLLVLITNLLQ